MILDFRCMIERISAGSLGFAPELFCCGVSAAGFVRTLRLSGVCCCLETASAAVGIAIQSFPAGGVSGTVVSQLVSAAPLELFQHP